MPVEENQPTQITILPTVGRMVYFKTRGSADGVYPPREFAAIITRVYEDGTISLASFGETGMRFEVKIEQGQNPGQWDWMPFQKDQQARLAPDTNVLTNASGQAVSAQ